MIFDNKQILLKKIESKQFFLMSFFLVFVIAMSLLFPAIFLVELSVTGNPSLYQISLDSSNSPIGLNHEQYQDVTNTNRYTSFQYHRAKAKENVDDHVILGKMGHITNIDPITELQSFSINYDVVEAEEVTDQYMFGFGYI
jgi:hypothetical protein